MNILIIIKIIKQVLNMYISIPDVFFVPIYYLQEDVLNMKKIARLQKYNSYNNFIERQNLLIGVSLPTLREARWVMDKETMENYAQSKGIPLRIENADTDAEKQASQVDNLLSQGINILILAPVDSKNAAALVEKAHKARVKVINYDRFIENGNSDLFVAFNHLRAGELQGQFLVRMVPKGNYIIMSGDPRDNNSKLLKEGAMEYIEPLVVTRNIKIVTDKAVDNWDPANAFKIVENSLIANNNNIDAILAPNDATAGAAIEALEAQGLAGKVAVTGMDGDLSAIQRIIKGTQAMTVLKDSREQGRVAIDAAIKLATAQGIDINGMVTNVDAILLTPIAVDKTNVDEVIIKSGYYTKEQVYGR
jgi:D-xylose transport system substrate-binding protein